MFWVRKAARSQPFLRPADGDPVLTEIDRLLAEGAARRDLSDADATRLACLATIAGVSADPQAREDAYHRRLELLKENRQGF